jgi:aminoglycoside 6-adenylyltransferase
MMEWHARATHDWEYDTWYGGRFIEEWTDLQTRNALPGLFAFYDVTDSWRALLTTMELYRRLATETAQILGYIYPALLDERVTQTVRKLFVEDSE